MNTNRKTLVVLGLGIFTLACCPIAAGLAAYALLQAPEVREFVQSLTGTAGDRVVLQGEIASAYPAQAVQVEIRNGHLLIITLVNSDYNELTRTEQHDKAEEIARFAKNNDQGIGAIDQIQVTFVRQAWSLGLSATQSTTYMFETQSLK